MTMTQIGAALLTALILAGCVLAPAGRPYYPPAPTVYLPPPAPRVEYMGTPPFLGAVWIQGYWRWMGARHEWVPGRWEAPRPGYRYVPHNGAPQGEQRWPQEGGRWEAHHDRDDRNNRWEARGR